MDNLGNRDNFLYHFGDFGDVLLYVDRLCHTREGGDDVGGAVALLPEPMDRLESALPVAFPSRLQRCLDCLWLRLVVDLEYGVFGDRAKRVEGRLSAVEDVPHVALRRENKRAEAGLLRRCTLLLKDIQEAFGEFLV